MLSKPSEKTPKKRQLIQEPLKSVKNWNRLHFFSLDFILEYTSILSVFHLKRNKDRNNDQMFLIETGAKKICAGSEIGYKKTTFLIQAILPTHQIIILSKFHDDRAKIVDFSLIANF